MINSLPVDSVDRTANDNAGLQLLPLLISLSKSTNALLGLRLAAIGLRIGQDEALLAVHAAEPTSSGAVAAKLGIRPSMATTLLGLLSEKGLVRPGSRGEGVVATAAGVTAQQEVRRLYRQIEAELLPVQRENEQLIGDLVEMQKRLGRLLTSLG